MKLEDLLSIEDYKEGLKALYAEYDLEIGHKQTEDLYTKYPEEFENETTTEEDRQEYINDHVEWRETNNHIKTNYGWDMTQLWELDNTIFQFLLPRLYIFYKNNYYYLELNYAEDGTIKNILEGILDALLNLVYTNEGFKQPKHDDVKINKGLLLLGKHIRRLWN